MWLALKTGFHFSGVKLSRRVQRAHEAPSSDRPPAVALAPWSPPDETLQWGLLPPCAVQPPSSLFAIWVSVSTSPLLRLPGDLCPYPGYVWLQQGLSVLIPSRLPQISCFTLSLKCFSSNPDNCPNVGIRPLLQFPHCRGQVQSCFPPLVPSSYRVLHGSIYSFPLVRYSCLLSAGVMHALLCLKVCSSCIHGERGTPCPPTLLPSCSPLLSFLIQRYFGGESIYENTFLQNGSLVHMFCILNFSF